MYIPKLFQISDREKQISFIEANSFGQLISSANGKLQSTYIIFMLSDDRSKLIGHMARKNPHWESLNDREVILSTSTKYERGDFFLFLKRMGFELIKEVQASIAFSLLVLEKAD